MAVSIRVVVDCSPTYLGRWLQRLELQLLAARKMLAAVTEQHEVAQVGVAAGNIANFRHSGMILLHGCLLGCSCAVQSGPHL